MARIGKKGIIALSTVGGVLLALVLVCVICWCTSCGGVNIILRNMFAETVDMPSEEWTGKAYENVKYSDVSENTFMDIYVPNALERPPLLVIIHGGGFGYNDLHSRQAMFMYKYFRENGFACATINYRLSDEAKYPAAIEDCKAAVRYLRKNADKYGYDPQKLAVWGESAGGYLATMLAVSDDDVFSSVKFAGETEADTYSAKIDVLVDFYGVMDFYTTTEDFKKSGVPKPIYGMVEGDYHEKWIGKKSDEVSAEERAEISPLSYIDESDMNIKAFIAHGDVDITVPYAQSEKLYEKLSAIASDKSAVRLDKKKNLKHAADLFYTSEYLGEVKDFLNSVLA